MTKNRSFKDCAKIVLWLSTAGNENPDTPKTHSSASNFHKYHSDTPRQPPDTPKTPPRHIQRTQDANRPQETQTDSPKNPNLLPGAVWICLLVSVGFCWRLLLSIGVLCSLDMSWGVLGVSGGCLGVVCGYLSDIYGNWRRTNVFWGYLGSRSLQFWAITLFWHSPERSNFLSPDYTETIKYQNVRI